MGDAEPAAIARSHDRLRRAFPAVAGLVLFVIALEVLRRELHASSWSMLSAGVLQTSPWLLVTAVLLTALNYAVLTGYDFIALASIGKRLPRLRVAGASFLAYAIANSVGFAMLSGASVRYRFYSRWGITADNLSRIVFWYSMTFWLGLLALGGISLIVSPLPRALDMSAVAFARPIGWTLLSVSIAYVVTAAIRRAPIRVRGFELPLPSPGLALLQVVVSAADWALAGAIFYVLLPPSHASFLDVLGAFLAAQILGLAAHVPGGVGVFEGVIVLLLKPYLTSEQLVPSLVVYRIIYYLAPLSVALVALVADEVQRRKGHAARITAYIGRMTEQLTPRILAVFTFIAGVVLLFSGATPAAANRLAMLERVVPLGVIETSHFVGSMTGAVLLLLSQGLARRLDAAYYLTICAVSAGMIASMLKGGDFEEAIVLGVLLLVLRRARPAFDRQAALFATRFSSAWMAAVAAALMASVWLGMFAFKHVEYSHDLWWQFAVDGEASRFLRGSVGAATAILLFSVARLMGHAPHEVEEPSSEDLLAAGAIIDAQRETYPHLVYLRDKALLFDERREGFVMYAVQGRTWVALGDPVGPSHRIAELIRLFIERCDDFGGTPVFYEVGKHYLHHYADFGLAFVKLGEEARVDLGRFCLDGSQGARFRQVVRRLEKDACTFRVVPVDQVPAVLPALRAVSDDWLERKTGAEKGFSVGFFDPEYIARFPVAVIERDGRVLAFANVWPSPSRHELSIDLMRYHGDAPTSAMEALIVHLLIWGKEQGYQWFALGMAPMSGFERSAISPLYTRAGNFLYEHGGRLYNFQGLRAYKDKFNPVWEPHYLAYPGGLKLPRIVTDISALIAGGYTRIFFSQ